MLEQDDFKGIRGESVIWGFSTSLFSVQKMK